MTIRACHLLGAPRCTARRTSITFVTRITPPYTRVYRWLRPNLPRSPPPPAPPFFSISPRVYACDAWRDQGVKGRGDEMADRWIRGGCLCPLYRSRGKEWPTVRPRKRPLYVTYVAFVKGPVVRVVQPPQSAGRVLWDTRQWALASTDILLPLPLAASRSRDRLSFVESTRRLLGEKTHFRIY